MKLISDLFYDPSVGYTGVQALYKTAKKKKKSIKLDDVRKWLRKQNTYTLHKPIRRKFRRRQTVVGGIDYQWQGDLADVSSMSKYNDGYRYLFCLIDVFSKYAWVVPIVDKSGKTLVKAMKGVLKDRSPKSLQTDKGKEFKNTHFQTFLQSRGIHFFTTENPETKASIVERFQRTLKTRMWKFFTHRRTLRYLDVLQKFVRGYNNAYHRSIKRAPASVNVHNEALVSEALYGEGAAKQRSKLKTGDIVRSNKTKRTFDKGYLPNWTQELFKVTRVNETSRPVTYKIEDLGREPVIGIFYSQEIQRVEPEQIFEIDAVLGKRIRKIGGKKWVKEVKVHWKGYPSKFDSWIPESELIV